jgi:hypothetical protein
MAAVDDTEAVVESVTAGDHDGHLVEIIEAVRLRFQFGTTEQRWKVVYHDQEFTEDDLTLNEARLVERISGTNWGMLNPVSSASECQAIITACLHTRQGKTLKFGRDGPAGDAWDEAGGMTTHEAVDAITSYEVERAPKS